jgi:hypothetical protein
VNNLHLGFRAKSGNDVQGNNRWLPRDPCKNVITLCEQNVELLNVKLVVHRSNHTALKSQLGFKGYKVIYVLFNNASNAKIIGLM